ncbi:MAG: hypothetical protein HXM17_00165 [Fusobacterium periodonticum]|nr:hypothetical protein [Fusobacterium periodonticum]
MKKIFFIILSFILLTSCNEKQEEKKVYTEITFQEIQTNFKNIQEDPQYPDLKIDKSRTDRVLDTYDEFENKVIYTHLNEKPTDKIKFSYSVREIKNDPNTLIKPSDFNILDMTVTFSCPVKNYELFNKVMLIVDGEHSEFKTEPGQRDVEQVKSNGLIVLNAPFKLNSDMYGLLLYLANAKEIKIRFTNDKGKHQDFIISDEEKEKIKDMYEWYHLITILQMLTDTLIQEKNKSL